MGKISNGYISRGNVFWLCLQNKKTVIRRSTGLSSDSTKNENFVIQLVKDIRDSLRLGVYDEKKFFPDPVSPPKSKTLRELIDRWLSTKELNRSTFRSYTAGAHFWEKHLANKDITKINQNDIKATLNSTKLSGKTKDNYKSVLMGILDVALKDDLIKTNPCCGIKKFKSKKSKMQIDPFEREEATKILTYLRDRNLQVYHYFAFAFLTGLRPSELIALLWSDVDFNKRYVRVDKAIVDHEEGEPKTKAGIRDVDLTDEALVILKTQKAFSFMSKDQRIFQNPYTLSGWASSTKQRTVWWQPCLKALGIRYRVPYNTRHTYACWMLSDEAVDIKVGYLSAQMGHDSIRVTEEYYGKWMDSGNSHQLELRNKGTKLLKSA